MTHVRSQLRADAVAAITGLATTGANVFDTRNLPSDQASLPCWNVYLGEEEVERASMSGLLARQLQLVFDGTSRAVADVDGTLDTMLEELETALAAGLPDAKDLVLESVETEFTDDSDVPYGRIVATYLVLYHTNEGAPSTAL